MSLCIICFLRRFYHDQPEVSPGYHPISPNLAAELEDSRKFALNTVRTVTIDITVAEMLAEQIMALLA